MCTSGASCSPSWMCRGAMYAVAGESKTMSFSGLTKSCYSLATFFSASSVHGALIREVHVRLLFFGGDWCRLRRGFVVV
jgi:hypothetical protein